MNEDLQRLQTWAIHADLKIEALEQDVSELKQTAAGLQHQIRHLKAQLPRAETKDSK